MIKYNRFKLPMSQTSVSPQISNKIIELTNLIQEKNQIIAHLQQRVESQEKQIDMLVIDAEEKHLQEIIKYSAKSYQEYLKQGKYLLLRVDEMDELYLSKGANIVHFSEIGEKEGNDLDGEIVLKEKQSGNFESSIKGLSMEISALRQKMKMYSQSLDEMADQEENSKGVSDNSNLLSQLQKKQEYIRTIEEKLKEDEEALKANSISPSKTKKNHTKTIFIRK